jgi:hypothetical protein
MPVVNNVCDTWYGRLEVVAVVIVIINFVIISSTYTHSSKIMSSEIPFFLFRVSSFKFTGILISASTIITKLLWFVILY